MSELSQKLLSRSKYYHSKNKDKNRYKKKAKHVVKSNQETEKSEDEEIDVDDDVDQSKFRRRAIQTNSHRYDEPEENVEEEDLSEMISMQENSHASQFRFLSEQEWDEEQLQVKYASEISVNYEQLGAALGSLPLVVKLKIEEELLTEDVNSHRPNTKPDSNTNEFSLLHVSAKEDKHNKFQSQLHTTITDKTLEDDQKALESLLNLPKQEITVPSSNKQEDLEQWLESVI